MNQPEKAFGYSAIWFNEKKSEGRISQAANHTTMNIRLIFNISLHGLSNVIR